MRKSGIAGVLLAALTVGCANAPVEEQVDPAAAVTFTTVTAQGVETVTLTAQEAAQQTEQLAMLKADAQAGITRSDKAGIQPLFVLDAGCNGSSLWLYDQPNQTGNRICFTDVGSNAVTDLIKFPYPLGGTWAGNERTLTLHSRVKSYWGGRQTAIGQCQDDVGQTPINCYSNGPFTFMGVFERGNTTVNLRAIAEYHPIT